MNVMRIAILGVAAIAAGAAAFLVRGILGGGTPEVQANVPEPIAVVQVLVANDRIEPGRLLTADTVRWEDWPDTVASTELITQEDHPDLDEFLKDAVTRSPLLAGEPITETKIAHVGSGTFMAATLAPGKRAVSIPISAESGAGGFILPNDRVDVILTRELAQDQDGQDVYEARTILLDVRVLAIDQTVRQDEEQESVVARTATLELDPTQSELISQAQATGTLSLALRGLGDNTLAVGGGTIPFGGGGEEAMTVFRYGIARGGERNLTTGPDKGITGVQTRFIVGGPQ